MKLAVLVVMSSPIRNSDMLAERIVGSAYDRIAQAHHDDDITPTVRESLGQFAPAVTEVMARQAVAPCRSRHG